MLGAQRSAQTSERECIISERGGYEIESFGTVAKSLVSEPEPSLMVFLSRQGSTSQKVAS